MRSRVDEKPSVASLSTSGQAVYYATDASQATFREIWRFASPSYLAFFRIAVAKLLRKRTRPTFGAAHASIRIVQLGEVSELVRRELADALAACQQLALVPRFAVTVPVVGDLPGGAVVHANRDRTVLAVASLARTADQREVELTLLSKLDDGRTLSATNGKWRFDPPPAVETAFRTGAPLAELVECHAARLKEVRGTRVVILDDVAQRQLLLDTAQRRFDYLRERGLLVPMVDAEVAQAQAKTPPSL